MFIINYIYINNIYNLNDDVIIDFNNYINKINNDEIDVGLSIFTSSKLINYNTGLNKLSFDDIKSNIIKYRMYLIIDYFISYIYLNELNRNELIKYYNDNINDTYSCIYEPPSFSKKIKEYEKYLNDDNNEDDDGFLEELAIRYRRMFPTIEQIKQTYNKYNNIQFDEINSEYNYTEEDYISENNESIYDYSDLDYDNEEYENQEEYYTDEEYY